MMSFIFSQITIPMWMYHSILIIGIMGALVGSILELLPYLKIYVTPVRAISIVLIIAGIYIEGDLAGRAEFKVEAAEAQAKVAQVQAESEKENVKIVTKVITKTQYYKTRGDDIVRYVDREVTKYDSKCEIPQAFVDAHNQAASKQSKDTLK